MMEDKDTGQGPGTGQHLGLFHVFLMFCFIFCIDLLEWLVVK